MHFKRVLWLNTIVDLCMHIRCHLNWNYYCIVLPRFKCYYVSVIGRDKVSVRPHLQAINRSSSLCGYVGLQLCG